MFPNEVALSTACVLWCAGTRSCRWEAAWAVQCDPAPPPCHPKGRFPSVPSCYPGRESVFKFVFFKWLHLAFSWARCPVPVLRAGIYYTGDWGRHITWAQESRPGWTIQQEPPSLKSVNKLSFKFYLYALVFWLHESIGSRGTGLTDNWTWVLWKNSSCSNCWTNSPAPNKLLYRGGGRNSKNTSCY